MQNEGYLQQLKEQVKVKSLELRRAQLKNEKTLKMLKEEIANSRNEISVLKATIKKKDEKISSLRKLSAKK
jgi:hypothetical protein